MDMTTDRIDELISDLCAPNAPAIGTLVRILKEPEDSSTFRSVFGLTGNRTEFFLIFGKVALITQTTISVDVETDRGNIYRYRFPREMWKDWLSPVETQVETERNFLDRFYDL